MKQAAQTFRIAVIGARRGKAFIRSSRSLDGSKLVAVCDTDPLRLEAWMGKVKVCQDIEDIFSDSEIEAVGIAAWSSISPLSALSVQQGNVPVSVPNFLEEKK